LIGARMLSSVPVKLNYQKDVPGKRVGRYINHPGKGELADEHVILECPMHDARDLVPAATLESKGFELSKNPTKVTNFKDADEMKQIYYPEMESLVKKLTGAPKVIVFDHTLRESGVTNLNASNAAAAAGTVARVHCDYSDKSGPERVKTLFSSGGYTGFKMTEEERDAILKGRFAFVNVWRNIDPTVPVQRMPLAVADEKTIPKEDFVEYEMNFPERVGQNYALKHRDAHKWYYYPKMTQEECLVFKVYESRPSGARFTFHTAFEHPDTTDSTPTRKSCETRTIAIWPELRKPFFFDMIHSNNAARIRLWIAFKGLEDEIDSKMIVYSDLQNPEYLKINPLKKVPGLTTEEGECLFESQVILNYLDDKYKDVGPTLYPGTPELNAKVQLLIRVHDIYISSPNCTQPNFSHTQGCMYLPPFETPFGSAERAMDRATRAAKLAEIWKQLNWLEEQCVGPYLTGSAVTLADFTWMPTIVFMEFMLPRVFGWSDIFNDGSQGFPKLAAWYKEIRSHSAVAKCHQDIWDFWVKKEIEGQFDAIRAELKDPAFKWKYP